MAIGAYSWRRTPRRRKGAFTPRIPTSFGKKVDCKIGQPRVRPTHVTPSANEPEVTGLITLAGGSFATEGVKSEVGVGVAEYKDAGILGPNEYSLQINTNDKMTTTACAGGVVGAT